MQESGELKESVVSKEVMTLQSRVNELAEAINALCSRLQPIAQPRKPEETCKEGEVPTTSCPLENEIRASRFGLEGLISTVRDMIARLAI